MNRQRFLWQPALPFLILVFLLGACSSEDGPSYDPEQLESEKEQQEREQKYEQQQRAQSVLDFLYELDSNEDDLQSIGYILVEDREGNLQWRRRESETLRRDRIERRSDRGKVFDMKEAQAKFDFRLELLRRHLDGNFQEREKWLKRAVTTELFYRQRFFANSFNRRVNGPKKISREDLLELILDSYRLKIFYVKDRELDLRGLHFFSRRLSNGIGESSIVQPFKEGRESLPPSSGFLVYLADARLYFQKY